MAVVIIYATVAGYAMHFVMDQPAIFSFLSILNMSLATVATPILVIRFIWSHFRIEPKMPSTIPTLQKSVAKLAHALIYLLMFLVFSTGYLMLKEPYSFFWLVTIDNIISSPEVNQFFFISHRVSCALLVALVSLHAAAALKHHFISKNYVLKMMI
ncbi:cytochrome b/b6 domain-containing protein [Vibrio makurazakiensis]